MDDTIRQVASSARAQDAPSFSAQCESSADTAAYIAQMSTELALLAKGAGLPMLAYFLNLARVEAQIYAREYGDRRPARGGVTP